MCKSPGWGGAWRTPGAEKAAHGPRGPEAGEGQAGQARASGMWGLTPERPRAGVVQAVCDDASGGRVCAYAQERRCRKGECLQGEDEALALVPSRGDARPGLLLAAGGPAEVLLFAQNCFIADSAPKGRLSAWPERGGQ